MRKIILMIVALFCWVLTTKGEQSQQQPSAINPNIQSIVKEISAQNIESTIQKLVSFGTRHTLSETESDTHGIGAARRWIRSELDRYTQQSGGRLKVEFDEFVQQPMQRVPQPTTLMNVVATLTGTNPDSKDRIYVVSGHYDSCVCVQDVLDSKTDAPGANDDGSGTAAVMELVRVMSRYEFDSTLVFLTVAGEEQGLLGSKHWAETAKQNNWNIGGMITNDIIGSSHAEDGHVDDKHVRLFAGELPPRGDMTPGLKSLIDDGGENDSPTRQLGRYIKEMGEKYVPAMTVTLILRRDRYGRGGDHSPFLDLGFPAVRFTEPNENYKHQHEKVRIENGVQYGDTPEFVDYKFIANVARVNAAALASLALAPAPPKNVHLELGKQENNTTLSWDANTESDIAGYQIVWRETTATFWQQKVQVGNVTRYTIPHLSKDNYVFGVQAIDREGNLSLATYPRLYRP